MFKKLYNTVLTWAAHKYSIYYLGVLSMVESFILPYPPPDILLAPMTLKNPHRGLWFAFICTVFSVIGGSIGYIIGYFAIDIIMPIVVSMGWEAKLEQAKVWFEEYGILIVFIAGFSPIPYKIFTIGAGIMSMAFLPFVIISFIARGLRFFLVAFIVQKTGDKCDEFLQKYVNYLGWIVVILIILFIGYKTI
jgi:membrane protein YqaA with SNARE-associated domain